MFSHKEKYSELQSKSEKTPGDFSSLQQQDRRVHLGVFQVYCIGES